MNPLMSTKLSRKRTKSGWAVATIVALLAALFTVGAVSTSRPASAESVGPTTTTIYSSTPAGDGNRVPDIISTSPNHVVAAWRTGNVPHESDTGDIQYSYSTDGGTTWSAAAYLAQSDPTWSYGYVMFFQNGKDLYAYIGQVPTSSTNGFPVTMIAKKSTDEGHTWSNFAISMDPTLNEEILAGRPLKFGTNYVIPFWQFTNGVTSATPRAGVLTSPDLVTWTAGNWVPDSSGLDLQEPQVVVSQDNPSNLVMEARTLSTDPIYATAAAYSATSTSSDGGLNWSNAVADTNIPNFQTKGLFAKDANGQYLAIYNTAGGTFNTMNPAGRPAMFRDVLYYKVKKPGQPWGAGQFLADATVNGWDTYPSYTEVSPGKFLIIWESASSAIDVTKLDISDAFTGTKESWDSLSKWTVSAGGGTVAISPAGYLHLLNANSGVSSVSQPFAPSATSGFVATMTGAVDQYSPFNTANGVGASMAMKVATGTERLMLTVQSDGIYSMVSGATTWSKVYSVTNDNATHEWKVIVDPTGLATLYEDGSATGATWTVQASTFPAQVEQWTTGTTANPAEATIDSTSVERYVDATSWDNLTGWTVAAAGGTAAIAPAGQLHLANANSGTTSVSQTFARSCDPTIEFRGQVDDYGTLNPSNGVGIALGVKVNTGAKRALIAIQSDGVYAMEKGVTGWAKVYSLSGAGSLHTWKAVVGSDGDTHLFMDGTDTGASWFLPDNNQVAGATEFASGTSADPVESHTDWLRVTCTNF